MLFDVVACDGFFRFTSRKFVPYRNLCLNRFIREVLSFDAAPLFMSKQSFPVKDITEKACFGLRFIPPIDRLMLGNMSSRVVHKCFRCRLPD